MKVRKKEPKKDMILGYESVERGGRKSRSSNETTAQAISSAVIEVNKFYASTACKKERVNYFHPNGQKQMILKRFKDGKEVTFDYFRSVILKASEDRGINFEHVLKVGGWLC